ILTGIKRNLLSINPEPRRCQDDFFAGAILFDAHRRPSMIAGDQRLLFRRKMAVEGVDFNLHVAGDGIFRYDHFHTPMILNRAFFYSQCHP
ncbi:MAG: hypothetical protein Q8N45_00120, partial [Anaerolineales bacterium]|nr:hypothetical protein [Anaerolineales bacterium]